MIPEEASPTFPIYRKVADLESGGTQHWFIVCDEGWRETIVCDKMYEWAADWLLEVLDRRQFAPNHKS